MIFKSYAKINISLDITGKRSDGYHDLKMVMHTVDLYDDIDISINDSGKISITTNLPYLPRDSKNLAYRAAECFFNDTGIKNPGIKISVFKRIPVCAGLAGGSSNAATVLKGLNKMFDAGLSLKELAAMGKQLGADVPYCVYGTTMLAEGIGDILTPLPPMMKAPIVLAKPAVNLSTAHVFKEASEITLHPDTQGIIKALNDKNLDGVCKRMYNVLEEPAMRVLAHTALPDSVTELKRIMQDYGAAGVLMSGSGPTVYGIFYNEDDAKSAYRRVENTCEAAFLTTT